MEIGPADTAAGDLDAYLPGKRDRQSAFHTLQRLALDRSGLVHGPGVHWAILTTPWYREKLRWTSMFGKHKAGVDVLHRFARQD